MHLGGKKKKSGLGPLRIQTAFTTKHILQIPVFTNNAFRQLYTQIFQFPLFRYFRKKLKTEIPIAPF